MPHFITSLCLRDGDCIPVCPVRCIVLGKPEAEWPWVYIDPEACIDCGTCVPECPYGAIFPDEDVPSNYQAKEGQRLNAPRDAALRARANERFAFKKNGKAVVLERTVALRAGQVVNLRDDIPDNVKFYQEGPGYKAREM